MGKIQLENITVGGLLRRTAEKYPQNIAIDDGEKQITYEELDRIVDAYARRIITLGLKKGDHVGILCETSAMEIAMKYALARIGVVACLLNTGLQEEELAPIIERSNIKALFIGASYLDMNYVQLFNKLSKQLANPIPVYSLLNPDEVKPAPKEQLFEMEKAVDPQDTVFIIYTSGSTGLPKAVMGSNYSRANCGIKQAEDMNATEKDKFLVALPTFHCFSLSVNIIAACSVGACLCIPKSRRTADLLDTIQEKKCTILSCVPTLFHALISRPDFDKWDVSSLRIGFVGGSMCTVELFKEFEDKLGMTILSSYGQTELTGGATTANPTDSIELRATSLGHLMDFVEGKIIDIATGKELPPRSQGEILFRGYNAMQGYYGMPEETKKAMDEDGWVHTGDLGYTDENNYFYINGRIKELIIRGGENISPGEIEAVIQRDERVHECKAVGVPDKHYGEEICACVVKEPGFDISEDEVRELVKASLAAYKIPKYVLFVDDFPRNTTGKIKLKDLQDLAKKMAL